ncbi:MULTISPECIES: DUF418 domain-containing protein [Actinoalloteichus]|uniref:DUF418 domain-containing protein n=1 Tax=Actinoalloteichus fjordicus TaxID=1612552 RepID=A0AAC9PUX4_9PSEU|nr:MULTISPECIES: DUF418 domain-containing protein [Actinoalloteichus]APU17391.1 putative DUF1624 family protein/Protein of unknown function (DUF418) [Actinoalloteichus fjordicus]APU23475.1 putative DUF1624 family protein/Protein of unknown function (DUF418) [Actinoalloteichus sp. GBA129-24]
MALAGEGRTAGGASAGDTAGRAAAADTAGRIGAGDTARLIGVDAARGLAVLGMFAAHLGPHPRDGGAGEAMWIFHGFPSALFALVAGLSLALLTGGSNPVHGAARRTAALRILLRALLLFPLGLLLAALGTNVLVILCYYAIYFVLALPLLWLRPLVVALCAGLLAVGGPLLSFAIRGAVEPMNGPFEYTTFSLAEGDGLSALFVTGTYPALTWLPFVLAGVVLGRLDLRRARTAAWTAAAGVVAVLLGYGGSWLVSTRFGARARLHELLAGGLPPTPFGSPPPGSGEAVAALDERIRWGMLGTVPTTDPAWLSIASPHSGTPFDVVGATGVALLVVAACLFLLRVGVIRLLFSPISAVGSMPLTIYSGHLVGLAMLGSVPPELDFPVLISFIVMAACFAMVWRRFVGRGPLEQLLHSFAARVAPSDEAKRTT